MQKLRVRAEVEVPVKVVQIPESSRFIATVDFVDLVEEIRRRIPKEKKELTLGRKSTILPEFSFSLRGNIPVGMNEEEVNNHVLQTVSEVLSLTLERGEGEEN